MLKRKVLCVTILFLLMISFTGTVARAEDNVPWPVMKILLAGYGWYRGIPPGQVNNAELVARALDMKWLTAKSGGQIVAMGQVYSIVVPVTWSGAWPPVEEAIAELEPDIIVGLGTAGTAAGVRPEPYASNYMYGWDADPRDPTKEEFKDEPIEPGGPYWREGNMPNTDMVLRMLKKGIPGRRGHKLDIDDGGNPQDPEHPKATPGWYLCNFLTWHLAKYVAEVNPDVISGFIHIPTQPAYRSLSRWTALKEAEDDEEFKKLIEEQLSPSLGLEETIMGVELCLKECMKVKALQ
jgi:pyroglutamyl-peptidase